MSPEMILLGHVWGAGVGAIFLLTFSLAYVLMKPSKDYSFIIVLSAGALPRLTRRIAFSAHVSQGKACPFTIYDLRFTIWEIRARCAEEAERMQSGILKAAIGGS